MSSYFQKRVLLFVTKVYWKKMGRGLTYLFIGQFCPILVTFGHFWSILAAHNPFCLENRQICCKSAQKKHEMIG
jgi:hypothetical protein